MFGIDTIHEATGLTDELLKIAIIGAPGIGKSWLSATAPKPVFNIDFDGRKSSLAGKTGVTVKSYVDLDPNTPRAMAELEADLGLLEYEKTKGNPVPATYVIDSLTFMKKAIDNELMKQQTSLGRGLKIGQRTVKIGQGYDLYNGCRAYVEYMIGRLSAMGNLIMVCHQKDEKDKKLSTEKEKKYTGKITIDPEFLGTTLSLFNDCWLMDVDWSGNRIIKTTPSSDFVGKNSLGLQPEEKDPDITKFVAAYKARMATTK